MNICLYGANSNDIDEIFKSEAAKVGLEIGRRGHRLYFGGGRNGLMGAAANGTLKAGGEVVGVAPEFFRPDGVLLDESTEMIYTADMRDRKKMMEECSDAFVVMPGGVGTFDEFFEIITLKKLARHSKPVGILNTAGYYDRLLDAMHFGVEKGFMREDDFDLFGVFDDPKLLIDYIEAEFGR